MTGFQLVSSFPPAGSQPEAIARLNDGLADNARFQTLLGVTGSGKTFTMANVIAAADKPTLVIAHNKTLAAQLYQEFCDFFPKNRIECTLSCTMTITSLVHIPAKDQVHREGLSNQSQDRDAPGSRQLLRSRTGAT